MARKRKPKSNVDVVIDIMEYSTYGALAQVFIMDAIAKHADAVAKMTAADFPEGVGAMVAPSHWIGVAKEIKVKMDAHLGPKEH